MEHAWYVRTKFNISRDPNSAGPYRVQGPQKRNPKLKKPRGPKVKKGEAPKSGPQTKFVVPSLGMGLQKAIAKPENHRVQKISILLRAICLSKLQYCGTILQCCSQENIRFDCNYMYFSPNTIFIHMIKMITIIFLL